MTARAARGLFVAEPPAQYLARPPVVVDCSAVAGVVFSEPWRDQASDQIRGRSLKAPYLLQSEITSVALKKHRQGFAQEADDGLAFFGDMDVELHPVSPAAVLAIALRYKLSAYDAAYLWLAADLKAPLATFDKKLATAAKAHLASLP